MRLPEVFAVERIGADEQRLQVGVDRPSWWRAARAPRCRCRRCRRRISISTTSQPRKRKPAIEPVVSATMSLALVQKCGGIGATGPIHSQSVVRTSVMRGMSRLRSDWKRTKLGREASRPGVPLWGGDVRRKPVAARREAESQKRRSVFRRGRTERVPAWTKGQGRQRLPIGLLRLGFVAGAHGVLDTNLQIDRLDSRDHAVHAGAKIVGELQAGATVEDLHRPSSADTSPATASAVLSAMTLDWAP